MEIYSKAFKQLKNITENNQLLVSLQKENEVLQNRLNDYESTSYIKRCLICKRDIDIANDKSLCYYHPRKIRYFSCRGCGADEYYICCNRCSRCSPGCKTDKHVYAD